MVGTQRGHKIPGMPTGHSTVASPEKDIPAQTSVNSDETGLLATKTKFPPPRNWRVRTDAKSAIVVRARKRRGHAREALLGSPPASRLRSEDASGLELGEQRRESTARPPS